MSSTDEAYITKSPPAKDRRPNHWVTSPTRDAPVLAWSRHWCRTSIMRRERRKSVWWTCLANSSSSRQCRRTWTSCFRCSYFFSVLSASCLSNSTLRLPLRELNSLIIAFRTTNAAQHSSTLLAVRQYNFHRRIIAEDNVSAPSSFIANAHNELYRVAQKSKPLPNDQKIVLNLIKACQWDYIYSSN